MSENLVAHYAGNIMFEAGNKLANDNPDGADGKRLELIGKLRELEDSFSPSADLVKILEGSSWKSQDEVDNFREKYKEIMSGEYQK